MVTRKEANVEWENVLANQFYHDVFGAQWEPDENGYWESNESGEFISPEKMRLKVWQETCGVPEGVATGSRPKYYVEWDERDATIRRWTEDSDETPITLSEAKKEICDHYRRQIDWYRAQSQTVRSLRAHDIEE